MVFHRIFADEEQVVVIQARTVLTLAEKVTDFLDIWERAKLL